MKQIKMIAATLASTLVLGGSVNAQEWPGDDLRYILHVSPGGATDVLARRLAEGMQQETGVNVAVENQPGGSGARQLALMSLVEPDGLTFGSVTASHLGMLQESDEFDINSIAWSCGMVLEPYLLAVSAESDIQTLDDLVAQATANPGSLTVGGFGQASGGHVAWAMFEEAGDIVGNVNWVPYDSVGDAVVSALGGHSDVVVAYVGLVQQYVASGDMRVIGIQSDTRSTSLPDVPTYADAGFDVDTTWQQFRGAITPAGTSVEDQQALCNVIEAVMQSEAMMQYISASELAYGYMPPAEFRTFVNAQNEAAIYWGERLESIQ
jgi:tripartite-type tricarboxylate transporter receptor subunit TctC